MVTSDQLAFYSDLAGLASAALLSTQSYRLIRHLRTVKGMRDAGKRQAGTETGNLANEGAEELEKTVSRWDQTDQRLVVTGFLVLALSFALKLAAHLMG
jgi:hypothetical protein